MTAWRMPRWTYPIGKERSWQSRYVDSCLRLSHGLDQRALHAKLSVIDLNSNPHLVTKHFCNVFSLLLVGEPWQASSLSYKLLFWAQRFALYTVKPDPCPCAVKTLASWSRRLL